jgi:hypothetical protein
VADLERRLGVRASAGGRHPGRGTRNALIAIGPRRYLEIVGPDREQPPPATPRWLGIDALAGARLVAWAWAVADLDAAVAAAAGAGVTLGAIGEGSRRQPDGALLRWRFTDPGTVNAGGLVPFLIDWGAGPHPAESATPGPPLTGLVAEHPEPGAVRRMLHALGIALDVEPGAAPALIARFATAGGVVALR